MTGLIKNVTNIARYLTVKDAFKEGLVLQSADRADSSATRSLIFGQLSRLIRSVNATRSFQSETDIQDAVDDIIELYPSLKVEEILICFKQIRQGKFELYGNLTTNTLIKCIQQYELKNTIPLREAHHKNLEPYTNRMIDWKRLSAAITVEKDIKSLEELGGYLHITQHDLDEIERAKQKSNS